MIGCCKPGNLFEPIKSDCLMMVLSEDFPEFDLAITEVKQRWAWIVLGWETALEFKTHLVHLVLASCKLVVQNNLRENGK